MATAEGRAEAVVREARAAAVALDHRVRAAAEGREAAEVRAPVVRGVARRTVVAGVPHRAAPTVSKRRQRADHHRGVESLRAARAVDRRLRNADSAAITWKAVRPCVSCYSPRSVGFARS